MIILKFQNNWQYGYGKADYKFDEYNPTKLKSKIVSIIERLREDQAQSGCTIKKPLLTIIYETKPNFDYNDLLDKCDIEFVNIRDYPNLTTLFNDLTKEKDVYNIHLNRLNEKLLFLSNTLIEKEKIINDILNN